MSKAVRYPILPYVVLCTLAGLVAGCDNLLSATVYPPPSSATICQNANGNVQTLDTLYGKYFASGLATGCAVSGCHGTGTGDLYFTNAHEMWQAIVGVPSMADPGMERVKVDDPANSYLYLKLLSTSPSRMPQGGPYLSDSAIADVAGWICAGAAEPALPTSGSASVSSSVYITGMSPTYGMVGTPVSLSGGGFSTLPASDQIAFNGTPAMCSAAATTTLSTSVPTGATTGKVTVAVGGTTATSYADFQVVLPNPVPSLSSVNPVVTLVSSQALPVLLTGSNFISTSTAQLDGVSLPSAYSSASELFATVPFSAVGQTGTHALTVVNPGPGGGTSGTLALTVVNPTPLITSLAPASAVVGSGNVSLQINGAGFVGTSIVTINGAALALQSVMPTAITVMVPSSLTASVGLLSVIVANPAPGGGTSASATLTIGNPVPVLTSINPNIVTAGSGSALITLSGSGFVASSVAVLDGANLSTTYVNATTLTASLDASVVAVGGNHNLTVNNAAPGGGISAPTVFSVTNPAPTLASINPNNVATNGAPFTMLVTGTGFNQSSSVFFNGSAVATTYVSSTSIEAQIPTLTTQGNYLVYVSNPAPGGGASTSATLSAAVSTVPTITGLSPSPGTANAAFALTITGSGYGCTNPNSQVLFNGTTLTPATCSTTSLSVNIPSTPAGSYTLKVQVGTQVSAGSSYSLVAPNPVPMLSSLSPSSAAAQSSGITLTANGSAFVSGAFLSFNGNNCTTTFVNPNQVTAAIPSSDLATAGSYPVVVTNPTPGGGASNALSFSVVTANPVPSITSLTPSTVAQGSGATNISIGGSGFLSNSNVTFNGSVRSSTFVSSSTLTLSLLATDTQTAGSYSVVVTNPSPGGGSSNSYTLTIQAQNPVPALSTISPTTAVAGGAGLTLTVNGNNFVSSSVVNFNGIGKTTTYVSATQLTAPLASTDIVSAGNYPVTVSTPTPGGGTSGTVTFTVDNPAPAISSISPTAASVGGSTFTLTVNGSGFVTASTVEWDGSALTTSYVNSTQVTATVPSTDISTTGTYTITVVNPTPGGGTSSGVSFDVASAPNPVPVINALSPCGLVAGSGAFTLTLTSNGNTFVNGATATFNGTAVTVTFVNTGELTAAIPSTLIAAAPTNPNDAIPVVVTNPSPGGGASSTVYFGLASQTSTLSGNVQSIFTANCALSGCHTGGSPAGGMNLSSGNAYANTVGVTSQGCPPTLRVLACGPLRSQSFLVDKILATTSSPACFGTPMPKSGPLSSSLQQLIVDWVAQGAPQ